jgi:hypothetical protein
VLDVVHPLAPKRGRNVVAQLLPIGRRRTVGQRRDVVGREGLDQLGDGGRPAARLLVAHRVAAAVDLG